MGSQQRRVHDLELELVELRKEAEARAPATPDATERDAAAEALAAEEVAHDAGAARSPITSHASTMKPSIATPRVMHVTSAT